MSRSSFLILMLVTLAWIPCQRAQAASGGVYSGPVAVFDSGGRGQSGAVYHNDGSIGLGIGEATGGASYENDAGFFAQVTEPEIALSGSAVDITRGDSTPDEADHTDFGSATISSGTVARTFTITNTGVGVLNLIGTPRVTLSGSGAFSVTQQPGSATVAASGGRQTFEVTFAPATAGDHSATVNIASDDADENPFTFTLRGEGEIPEVAATFATSGTVPVTASSYTAEGKTVNLALTFVPPTGTSLTVVNNTGLDLIEGEFDNLAQGQTVVLTQGGLKYRFVADYYGGTGNDLVLRWGVQRLVAWGVNNLGQIGDGTTTQRSFPTTSAHTGALVGKFVLQVAHGGAHSVVLCSDGTLAAWGNNAYGQLGDGTTTDRATPVAVDVTSLEGRRVVAISAGTVHSLALCSDGTMFSWGSSNAGRLGNGFGADYHTIQAFPTPVAVVLTGVLAGKKVVAISAGSWHNLVLCSDGTLATWGSNSGGGQLGNNYSPESSSVPVLVTDLNGVLAGKTPAAIATGTYHNLVLCTDGTLVSWGGNELTGAVGDGSNLNRWVPVLVNQSGVLAGKTVTKIVAGGHNSMAIGSDGSLATWGWGNIGQLGNGTTGSSAHLPVLLNSHGVLSGRTVVDASRFTYNGYALCSDGTLASWGQNFSGELGIGSVASTVTTTPVVVSQASLAVGEKFARPTGGTAGLTAFAFAMGAGGYVDEPGAVTLAASVFKVNQGAELSYITLNRTSGAAATSVTVTTSNGTSSTVPPFTAALSGTDYTALTTVVNFAEGELSKVVPIILLPKTGTAVPNKRFTVTLSSPTGGAELGAVTSSSVQILANDTLKPTLTVTAPAATATTVSALSPYQVKGLAGDAKGIDRVEIVLNGAPPVLAVMGAATSNASRPYSLDITPEPGPNTLVVTAYDLRGNSIAVTRSFSFTQRYLLSIDRVAPVALDTAGTLTLAATPATAASALAPTTANANPKTSAIVPGTPVKLTAMAKAGYFFSHWTGSPSGAVTLGNVLTFTMPAADVPGLTATFVANPFFGPVGASNTFYGLIHPQSPAPSNNSTEGFFTGTLSPTNGLFNGKVLIDGVSQAFIFYFYGNGYGLFNVGTTKQYTLTFGGRELSLHHNAGVITATVTHGVNTSVGTATRGLYSTANKVTGDLLNVTTPATAPAPNKGSFTIGFPTKAQEPVVALNTYPQGDGFGSVTLTDLGIVTLSGTLADGSMVTGSSGLVDGNTCPIFVQLTAPGAAAAVKGGSFSGTLTFDTSAANSDVSGTDLVWFRPTVTPVTTPAAAALATNLYTAGWPNGIHVDAVGALYDKTATVQTSLGLTVPNAATGNVRLTFTDGKLTSPVTKTSFNITGNVVSKTPDPVKVDATYTLTLTPTTGAFSGTFPPNWTTPSATKPAFKGILIQKGANKGGFGYFLSNRLTDLDPESGGVTLGAQ